MTGQLIVTVDRLGASPPDPPFSAEILYSSRRSVEKTADGRISGEESGKIESTHFPQSRPYKLILPAVYHDMKSKSNTLQVIDEDDKASLSKYLRWELDLSRLDEIHDHLWLAGRPSSVRALHRQIMIGREITITEQADLHLVWQESRIYLKPMPGFLLDFGFWKNNLCRDEALYQSASGFLLSYVWLICHKSDLRIAHSKGLLPPEIDWERWILFSKSLLQSVDTNSLDGINRRYHYGELRLTRLNWIYRVASKPRSTRTFVLGYMSGYNRYSVFVQRNFTWVLAAFVYVTIVLTAMQVGLATDQLGKNELFQNAASGFTIFSMLAPIVAIGVLTVMLSILFIFNLLATLTLKKNTKEHRKSWSVQQRISGTSSIGQGQNFDK